MPEAPTDAGALKWWLRLLEVEADRDLLLQTVKTLSDRVTALERQERQRLAREGESRTEADRARWVKNAPPPRWAPLGGDGR